MTKTTFLWLKRIMKFIPLYWGVRRDDVCLLSLSSCWIIAKWKAQGGVKAYVQRF